MSELTNISQLYSKWQTDPLKETQGADLDLGICVITVARAGGSNEVFEKDFSDTFAPFNQVMELQEMPESKARELTYGVYSRSVVKRWRFRDPDTKVLVDGLGTDDEGKVVPATPENIAALFKSSHDLFVKVRSFAQSLESFLLARRVPAAKN